MSKILKDRSGITMGETLVGFLIICIATIMLTQCILLAVNTIASTRKDTEDTQNMVKLFWNQDTPNSSVPVEFTISDGKNMKNGKLKVQVDTYDIQLEDSDTVFPFYEFSIVETTKSIE